MQYSGSFRIYLYGKLCQEFLRDLVSFNCHRLLAYIVILINFFIIHSIADYDCRRICRVGSYLYGSFRDRGYKSVFIHDGNRRIKTFPYDPAIRCISRIDLCFKTSGPSFAQSQIRKLRSCRIDPGSAIYIIALLFYPVCRDVGQRLVFKFSDKSVIRVEHFVKIHFTGTVRVQDPAVIGVITAALIAAFQLAFIGIKLGPVTIFHLP